VKEENVTVCKQIANWEKNDFYWQYVLFEFGHSQSDPEGLQALKALCILVLVA
jgi:hypothetical protein